MALFKCSNCGKEISDTVKFCPNCGTEIKKTSPLSSNSKTKNYILIGISIILIIVAISLVTTNEFKYYLDNIDYYTEQYENAKSHSSGFLGSIYSSLASQWKEMREEAVMYVALHSIGAIVLGLGGTIGLYKGIRKLKNGGATNNGTN